MLLGVDPGNTDSAYMLYDQVNKMPVKFGKINNLELLDLLKELREKTDTMVVEHMQSMGMSVGSSVFETCYYIGRLQDRWISLRGEFHKIFRKDVKMHICGSMRAKDSNIRQAIMDRYGSTREKAIGKKATPGPLYGVKSDIFSALAVSITFVETKKG